MDRTDYDVVVVGSGPAGATTARVAAAHGLKILLVDKKQELGAPIQCSGAVSAHALRAAEVEPDDEFVSTNIHGFKIYESDGGSTVLDYQELRPESYKSSPLGYVVDRRRFDRHLMTLAERVGTEVWLKTEAAGYERLSNGRVKIFLKRFQEPLVVTAKIIVGADGLQSQVGKWARLKTHIKLSELASCLQFIIDGVETNGFLELISGHKWAPGGYAWIFPKGHGYAEIGLGVIRTMTQKDAHWYLNNFMKNSFMADRLKNSRVIEIQGGGVPLTAPLKRQYADNIILVGDAARHVNPITGGGIHTALRCGVIAGTFLKDFISSGKRPEAEALSEYQQRWHNELGKMMWKLYDIKRNLFEEEIPQRDKMLHQTLSEYFNPNSDFRKI